MFIKGHCEVYVSFYGPLKLHRPFLIYIYFCLNIYWQVFQFVGLNLVFKLSFFDLDPSRHLFVGIDTRTRPWNQFVFARCQIETKTFFNKKLNIILGSLGKQVKIF
jgi:hypothetical protein